MAIILNEKDIKTIIKNSPQATKEITNLVEKAFRELANEQMTVHPRVHVSYPPFAGGDSYSSYERSIRILPAILPGFEAAGFRFYSTFSPDGMSWTEQTEWITLLDYKDMKHQAFLSDHYIHEYRTAAPSGVAVRYLARKKYNKIGIFGTGRQAQGLLRVLVSELKPNDIKVFGRNRERRNRFAEKMANELGVKVSPVETPKEVCSGVDVIGCVTKTDVPVFNGEWVEKGTTILSLARNELDEKTLLRAGRIITGSVEQTLHDTPARQPYARLVNEGKIAKEKFEELAFIVAGKLPAREDDQEIIVFVSPGMAMLDVAIGSWIYQNASKMGIGKELNSYE